MNRWLGRLQIYVLTRTMAGVGGALVIIASVVMLINFVQVSRSFGGRSETDFTTLVELMLLQSPAIILLLLPFAFLFGVLAAFVGLNRRSELIAMRAAGVSAWRFIFPAAGAAFLVGIITVTLLNPVAAAMNGRFEDAKQALSEGRSIKKEVRDIWLRQGDARTQIVIHAVSHDMRGGVVRLHGVSLFVHNVTPRGGLEFSRRIEAAEARLDPGFWRLTDVREATAGAGAVRSETLSIPSTLDHRSAMERFANTSVIPFWELPDTIRHAETAGFSSAAYRLRLQQLLATPLLFAAMAVLAAAFSLRLMRLGGVAGLAGIGVTLGFLVFFSNQFCGALGTAEVLPPVVAGWATPVVALIFGFTLLCYTEDG